MKKNVNTSKWIVTVMLNVKPPKDQSGANLNTLFPMSVYKKKSVGEQILLLLIITDCLLHNMPYYS